jgi:hypothetical protein
VEQFAPGFDPEESAYLISRVPTGDRLDTPRSLDSVARFPTTRPIRIKNRKKLLTQAIRAPTVVDDGVRLERPMPWTQARTSAALTRSGVKPRSPNKGHNWPGRARVGLSS